MLAAAVSAFTRAATAEPSPEESTLAQALFDEGRRLAGEGRWPEACAKLEESYRIDRLAGVLLNLSICHEQVGKTATAWAELKESLSRARRDDRPDREALVLERLAQLEPRLARVAVTVSRNAAAVPGLTVLRDGVLVNPAAWGSAVPVDPGAHVVVAAAPGRKGWVARVAVRDRDVVTVDVPVLEPAAQPAAAPPAVPPRQHAAMRGGTSPRKIGGLALLGLGAASVAVGAGAGVVAFVKEGEADDRCPGSTCSDAAAVDASRAAQTAATVANVAIGAGLAVAAAGAVLVLTAPEPARVTMRIAPSPFFGPAASQPARAGARIGLSIAGAWEVGRGRL